MDETPVWCDMLSETTVDATGKKSITLKSTGHEKARVSVCLAVKGDGTKLLKLINYLCRSYPTRASYSGQVDDFRNPMKNELKTWPCLKPVFEIISNTDANFLNLHIATKTCGNKQLFNHTFYETNFKPKLHVFIAIVECNGTVI